MQVLNSLYEQIPGNVLRLRKAAVRSALTGRRVRTTPRRAILPCCSGYSGKITTFEQTRHGEGGKALDTSEAKGHSAVLLACAKCTRIRAMPCRAVPGTSTVLTCEHHHPQGRDERIFEPGVVVHDDGHPPNVWKEAAAGGRRWEAAVGGRNQWSEGRARDMQGQIGWSSK